ncbi:hypothetical protein GQX74_014133 [Glossina fuscipes]|nr:hypothetical protein GQX74_014133 [Glossina fuscipes]
MNLFLISSLPDGAIKHIRIHWMRELIKFIQFNQSAQAQYNFDALDRFWDDLDEMHYAFALRRGLNKAGQNLRFVLRGPAGLFKSPQKHRFSVCLWLICRHK